MLNEFFRADGIQRKMRDVWEVEFFNKYENLLEMLMGETTEEFKFIDEGEFLKNKIIEFNNNENSTLKDIIEIHFIYRYIIYCNDDVQKYYDEFVKSLK
jgi:hypothetical protein